MNRSAILTVMLLLAAGCSPPASESTSTESPAADSGIARTPDGKPDFNGIWQAVSSAHWNLEPHAASQGATEVLGAIGAVAPGIGVVEGGVIPYLPEALAQRELNFTNRRTEDPEAKCFRPGVPRATYMPYPFQIFQTGAEIFITYQFASATRSVFMQEQTEAPFDSWMGWSNGHWEGDTLVVEVSGLNGQAWLDRAGNHASAGVRVVERYTPDGPDHIRYEATIEDPAVFSRPWTIALPLYRLVEPEAQLLEFKCIEFAEELMYGHLSKPVSTSGEADDE
jgi:hypothetical protein